ncbi:MAG TPA: helix-turn-helix domain-containing protein [Candidatus Saccharimonadales bacterium]|nr:helix-turn-helix domain-containing protein [Candidatus Saccharimonadales bacterium]
MSAGFTTKKISKPKTLGSILRSARTKAELTVEQAQEQTKICERYLIALEQGNYAALPAEAYNIGFIRTYASFLKLNPDKIVRLYREERSLNRLNPQENQVVMRPRKIGDWHFLITPKVLAILGTVIFFGALVGYIAVELNRFAQPPTLAITNVPSQFTSSQDKIKLAGHTDGGATVLMNSQTISVADDGSFSQDVQLNPGVNQITILARNRAEKVSTETVQVLYNPDLAKTDNSVTKE